MKISHPLFLVLALLAVTEAEPVRAQRTSITADEVICLGGRQIMDIRAGIDGCSPHQRADRVRRRLVPILGIADLRPADIIVRRSKHGRDVSISVHHHLLVVVDKVLARANGMTPRILADHWAAVLSVVLPQVCVQGRRRGD